MKVKTGYTYDDILLIPRYSSIRPDEVNVETTLGGYQFKLPFASAAMDTVTGADLAIKMIQAGALPVLHKNQPIDSQEQELLKVREAVGADKPIGVAVSCLPQDKERIDRLLEHSQIILFIDTAHGHTNAVDDTVKYIKNKSEVVVCAGNIVTAAAAEFLFSAGADIVKVGIGPSRICSTRVVAGVGHPQFSAVEDVCTFRDFSYPDKHVIADGGINQMGDLAKAIAAGADMVMMGGMFAGCIEAPGARIDGGTKVYRGMGSEQAMEQGSDSRYFQTGFGKKVAEGVSSYIAVSGSVTTKLKMLESALAISMGYLGAATLQDAKDCDYTVLTNAGIKEGMPYITNSETLASKISQQQEKIDELNKALYEAMAIFRSCVRELPDGSNRLSIGCFLRQYEH